jgi:hypothetical protein
MISARRPNRVRIIGVGRSIAARMENSARPFKSTGIQEHRRTGIAGVAAAA